MATYVVGDPHGHFQTFLRLLSHAGIGSGDRVLFVGDLVNRGPQSLEMLQWVRDNSHAEAVLGNHDIFMLMVHEGLADPHGTDTTRSILNHPDAPSLCDWLRNRPFALDVDPYLIVHAGIAPDWTIGQIMPLAREVEQVFRGKERHSFFPALLGNQPALWKNAEARHDRLRFIVNALTRIRMCETESGAMDFSHKEGREDPEGRFKPWFEFHTSFQDRTVVFGHWASLGAGDHGHVISLDSGCAWDGGLSCLRLEDRRMFTVPTA